MTLQVARTYRQPLPLALHMFATGTWTFTANTGIGYWGKSAANETSVLTLPISLPFISGEQGVKLRSIELRHRIATQDLDAVLAGTLYRRNLYLAAADTDITATTITGTETGAEVGSDAQDQPPYIFTITDPAWVYSSTITLVDYQFSLSINCGTSTAFRLYSAVAVYDTY